MPIPTPFHPRTSARCESHEWRNWAGYLAAGTYEPSHEREYYAIRSAAALIDVTPLFKYEVFGRDAPRLLDRIMTRNIGKCAIGQVMYGPWCDEDGKIIDDGTVSRLDQNHFRITAADPNFRWFETCSLGMAVEIVDVTQKLSALALQGPNARKILKEVFIADDLDSLKYFRLTLAKAIRGFPVTITRTGYTGDLGYEIWVAPEHAVELWDALIEKGEKYGLLPAGIIALDIARIEAGLLLGDVDYISSQKALIEMQKSSPLEVGLEWAVSFGKGDFVGRKALEAEKRRGPKVKLVGLAIDWVSIEKLFAGVDLAPQVGGRASRLSVPIFNKLGRQIGKATSSTFSPILKQFIAIGTVESEYAEPGTPLLYEFTVEHVRQKAQATVVKTPFFDPERKRA